MNRFKNYCHLLRLHKPIGILLLLWPTLWALWLAAGGWPPRAILLIFIAGTITMRSAGCIINDIVDRNFDRHVSRTQHRPLTAGNVSLCEALILFVLLMLVALFLVWQLNVYTRWLAVLAAIFTVLYPFLKRITHLPQVGLGVTFSFGVPMAFTACTNHLSALTGLTFITALIWVVMYDTLYAMTDRADDIRIGIRSTAILFGRYDRLIIGILQTCVVMLLAIIGYDQHLHIPYYLCLTAAALLFAYQQWLIRTRAPTHCFRAFLNNHWVGMLIFIGIII